MVQLALFLMWISACLTRRLSGPGQLFVTDNSTIESPIGPTVSGVVGVDAAAVMVVAVVVVLNVVVAVDRGVVGVTMPDGG